MNKFLVIFLVIILIAGCKNKKKTTLSDNDTVELADFVDFFPELKLPILMDDSVLLRKETDSSSIGYKILTQFVPDSLILNDFGAGVKPKIYPIGKVVIKDFETYLFLKAISFSKRAGYIIALNNENTFIAGMPLVMQDKDPSTFQVGLMDKKYTVTQIIQRRKPGGESTERKKVYILNGEMAAFSLIMTDQGVAEEEREIINPIDTLPHKNKYSGDYIKDKRNYVSIRDGKKPSEMLFFIHFEKDNGDCVGELKGIASLHGTKTAIYRASGNPCVLELNFGATSVALKEQEACGSYRDIKCFFDGSFAKRKEPKPKVVSKRKK